MVPQTPTSFLGKILCDADLDYLGRNDFEPIAYNLFLEFQKYLSLTDERIWFETQFKFLNSHTFFTEYARMHRQEKKNQNIEGVRKRLEELTNS